MKFPIITLSIVTGASATSMTGGIFTKDNVPNTGREWVTLDNGYQFQPAGNMDPPMEFVRKLTQKTSTFQANPYASIFVDGTETHYDEYAQAWRALGFYIDCDSCVYGNNNQDHNNDNHVACVGDKNYEAGCQRFLLWAAVSTKTFVGSRACER